MISVPTFLHQMELDHKLAERLHLKGFVVNILPSLIFMIPIWFSYVGRKHTLQHTVEDLFLTELREQRK